MYKKFTYVGKFSIKTTTDELCEKQLVFACLHKKNISPHNYQEIRGCRAEFENVIRRDTS